MYLSPPSLSQTTGQPAAAPQQPQADVPAYTLLPGLAGFLGGAIYSLSQEEMPWRLLVASMGGIIAGLWDPNRSGADMLVQIATGSTIGTVVGRLPYVGAEDPLERVIREKVGKTVDRARWVGIDNTLNFLVNSGCLDTEDHWVDGEGWEPAYRCPNNNTYFTADEILRIGRIKGPDLETE